jgi:phage shock protein A
LTGVSTDSSSKNLEAIRNARQKSKAVAKLSTELNGVEKIDLDKELQSAGSRSKHLSAFDTAISGANNKAKSDPFATLPGATQMPNTNKNNIIEVEAQSK